MFKKIYELITHPEHRHTVFHSILALSIRVMGAGMSFAFNLVVARQLGAEKAGIFFLALAIAIVLSAIARLGFDNTVLRFTAANSQNGKTVKSILHFTLRFSVPFATLIAVLTFYNAPFIAGVIFKKNLLENVLQYISPAIVGFAIVSQLAMSLQARHKIFYSIPCQNIAHFFLCGAIIFAFQTKSPESIALYLSLSLGVSSSFFYWVSLKGINSNGSPLNSNGSPLNSNDIWSSARPNWFTTIMSQTVQWCAPIIIGLILASEQVAYFSVAQRIALLTSFILMAVNLVVAPKFAKYRANGDDLSIKKTALFSVKLLILSACPVVLFMLLFPKLLMGLFGKEFEQGAVLLQILVLGQAVNVITGSVGVLLQMTGYEKDMRLVTMVSGFGVLASVPFFTKLYGPIGAASSMAFFISLQNLLAVYFVKKRLGFNTLAFWRRVT
ncbi:oligosaccharide flippase family protein [Catenovulum sp. SX2]|uniref:oligosaccharide flippase family protein n=1 Tax=Catenovulum sp. SX2 TaxID=3398614 RepID=UPI003F863327